MMREFYFLLRKVEKNHRVAHTGPTWREFPARIFTLRQVKKRPQNSAVDPLTGKFKKERKKKK